MKRLALLLLMFAGGLSSAADDVRMVTSATASSSVNPIRLDAGKFIWVSLPTWESEVTFYPDPEDQRAVTLYPVKPDSDFPGVFHQGDLRSKVHRSPKSVSEVLMVTGEEPGLVTISAWGVKKDGERLKPVRLNQLVISVGGVRPTPPPGPNPPGPTPTPQPVQSFRVILVNETGRLLTPVQNSFWRGEEIEEYLKSNTTSEGVFPGFRRYDKDTDASNDSPVMAALWAAVRPKITTVPCLVVERNGKVDILPYPSSPSDGLATLKKYREGK